eukprot:16431-Heterococcus_DN1.PRE.4
MQQQLNTTAINLSLVTVNHITNSKHQMSIYYSTRPRTPTGQSESACSSLKLLIELSSVHSGCGVCGTSKHTQSQHAVLYYRQY